MTTIFAFIPGIGATEIIILLILGVLFFGRKLPEVGRYLGKGIVEFKKGVKGLEDDLDTSAAPAPPRQENIIEQRPPQKVTTTAPKFEDAPVNVTTPPKA